MPRTAVFPGSFDPFTNGHLHTLRAGLILCDRLVVGVGVHPSKAPLLSASERMELIGSVAGSLVPSSGASVEVRTFDNLVVDFAREVQATILIRGLRDGADFDYEMQMAGMNGAMTGSLQTVFIPARPDSRHITATLVRQVAVLGGDIAPFVPPGVVELVRKRLRR